MNALNEYICVRRQAQVFTGRHCFGMGSKNIFFYKTNLEGYKLVKVLRAGLFFSCPDNYACPSE